MSLEYGVEGAACSKLAVQEVFRGVLGIERWVGVKDSHVVNEQGCAGASWRGDGHGGVR